MAKYGIDTVQVVEIASPIFVSFVLYVLLGWLNRNKEVPGEVDSMLDKLELDKQDVVKDLI